MRGADTDPELGRPDPTVGASAQSFLLEANDLVRDQEAGFQMKTESTRCLFGGTIWT